MIRPRPNASDIALATAFIDGPFASSRDAEWIARHRDELIRMAADAEMQARQHEEWARQALAPVRRGIAA